MNRARAKTELFPERVREMSQFAAAMAHPARISVVMLLHKEGEIAAMDIVAALPLSQPACARHLAVLKSMKLVRTREAANQVFSSLNKGHLRALCEALGKNLAPKR